MVKVSATLGVGVVGSALFSVNSPNLRIVDVREKK